MRNSVEEDGGRLAARPIKKDSRFELWTKLRPFFTVCARDTCMLSSMSAEVSRAGDRRSGDHFFHFRLVQTANLGRKASNDGNNENASLRNTTHWVMWFIIVL